MEGISTGPAVLWWIGVLALFLVVIPLVLLLAQRVLRDLREVRDYAADILDNGVAVTANLEPVPELVRTQSLVRSVGGSLGEYAQRVGRLVHAKEAAR